MSDAYIALTLATAAMLGVRLYNILDCRSSLASYLLPGLAIVSVSVALGPAHSREVSAALVCEYGVTARDCDDLVASMSAAPALDMQYLLRDGGRGDARFDNGN